MQNTKIQIGMVKPLPKQYRKWFVGFLGLFSVFLFYIYSHIQKDDFSAIFLTLIQLPSVIIVSLPSLFPEKEIFQLFVQFTDNQLLYRNNYLKGALLIDYSEIQAIEIKPTKVILLIEEKSVEIAFNTMGYKTTKKIKANFESLKEELNK